MKSPKTTALGVLSIVSAIISIVQAVLGGHPVDFSVAGPAILSGVGLIFAQDNNKGDSK